MSLQDVWMIATGGIYNLAILVLLARSGTRIGLREMLREKKEDAAAPAGAATSTPEDVSYSRVAGLAGAAVLACFIWALGNAILFKAFTAPEQIGPLLTGISPFILSSSALFAPYAVNQLSSALRK